MSRAKGVSQRVLAASWQAVGQAIGSEDGHPRQCETASGKPKARFLTRQEAKREAKRAKAHRSVYRCSICGHFHVGTLPPEGRGLYAEIRSTQSAKETGAERCR